MLKHILSFNLLRTMLTFYSYIRTHSLMLFDVDLGASCLTLTKTYAFNHVVFALFVMRLNLFVSKQNFAAQILVATLKMHLVELAFDLA